jgi:MFS family permease
MTVVRDNRIVRLLRGVRLDTTPLRDSRAFRLVFTSSLVSLFGSFVTMVAAPLQLKELTGSYVAVGLVGVAEFVPLVVFGLWGGAIADTFDRRGVVLGTELAQLLLSVALLGNALLPHPQVWPIYAVAAGVAGATAVQRPSLDALLPRLVTHEQQPAANALRQLTFYVGAVVAPALGGALAAASLPWAYGLDVATFVASAALLLRVRPVAREGEPIGVTLAAIREGVRYAASRKDLLGTYVVDVVAMAFAMPQALFPFLADQLHHPGALGLLYSAGAVGGLLATLTSGWTNRVHRHGVAICLAAATWGAGMALAGLCTALLPVLACLALAEAGDTVSGIFRGTVWNQTIPDELRGRLAGIELLSYSSGPTLGNARAGLMARLGGVRFSIGVGGLLCIGGVAVTAALLPSFLRYDNRTDPYAIAESARRAAGAQPAPG